MRPSSRPGGQSLLIDSGKEGKLYDDIKDQLYFSDDGRQLATVVFDGDQQMVVVDGVEGNRYDTRHHARRRQGPLRFARPLPLSGRQRGRAVSGRGDDSAVNIMEKLAMARYELTTTPIEKHRLRGLFLKVGVSAMGTEQFLAGELITSPADRRAIAKLVSQLVNGSDLTLGLGSRWQTHH